jgi:integrase
MANYLRFGKRLLEGLPLPDQRRRVTYHDTQQEGLTLRVTHTGSKTFIVRCRINGVPEYKTLGKFPALTVENARKASQDFLGRVARGENPSQDRRNKKAGMTLDEGFSIYMDKHIRPRRAERTIQEYERMYRLHASTLSNRKLSAISYQDVDRLHASIGKNRGKYIANRVAELIKSTYSWLQRKRHYSGENPAWGIEKFPEHSRDRFLLPEELPRFFDSVAEEPSQDIRDYVLLALMTGARKQNMLAIRWDEIDFNREVWRIPITKNQEPVNIPLIPAAIDVLKARKQLSESEWVFPANSQSGHMTSPAKGWMRVLERAGIEDLRIHDLRRSMGSWQAINQTSLIVIAKSLGQKSTQAAAVYSRLNLDPVRESMEQAARSMLSFQNSPKESNVTQIKKKG